MTLKLVIKRLSDYVGLIHTIQSGCSHAYVEETKSREYDPHKGYATEVTKRCTLCNKVL